MDSNNNNCIHCYSAEAESGCGSPPGPGSDPTTRTHSSASVHSEGHTHPHSSSSSLSCDMSQASSFNSKELLEVGCYQCSTVLPAYFQYPRCSPSCNLEPPLKWFPNKGHSSSYKEPFLPATPTNLRSILQQLVKDFSSASLDNGEPLDRNEVVQQLLEHIITLKLVSAVRI